MTPLERIAHTLVDRVGSLLCTQVWVSDEDHLVIASNVAGLRGRQLDALAHVPGDVAQALYVPLTLAGQGLTLVATQPLNGEAISQRLAEAIVQLVLGQISEQEDTPRQPERKQTFIYDLLQGTFSDEQAIIREASMLGMDLATPRTVLLIEAVEFILGSVQSGQLVQSDPDLRRRVQLVISSIVGFFHLPNDTICAYIGNGEVAVLKASNTRNLVNWAEPGINLERASSAWANLAALTRAGEGLLDHLCAGLEGAVSIGIGRYHPGMFGIARSYQDARTALSLGQRFYGQNRVHCLSSLGIAAFVGLADEQTKVELATHLLSPLDHEPELFETLTAFFAANCSPSETADQLSIHRNTLGYRLQKIALLTGLDPRRFDEAGQIYLALLLRSLNRQSSQTLN